MPDARFLSVFPYSKPGDGEWEQYWEDIRVMAGVYRDMLPQNELPPNLRSPLRADPGLPHLKELTSLCRTLHLINFLTDTYITTQLAAFSLAGGDGTPATAPLSRPERQHITRAFYRRQLLSNAWAPTLRPPSLDWDERDVLVLHETRTGLLAPFRPWDMQRVDHTDCFIVALCRHRSPPVWRPPRACGLPGGLSADAS